MATTELAGPLPNGWWLNASVNSDGNLVVVAGNEDASRVLTRRQGWDDKLYQITIILTTSEIVREATENA